VAALPLPNDHLRSSHNVPKMKTDRGAAKRFKITGSGKLRRRQAFRSHLLEKKTSTRTRRLGREVDVAPADRKAVKRLLGI
jgi:large subunit ribosomal protein L35